ncbi:MAG: NB-ARC domain-containing protein, partial [Cyanobacteria bacterium J06641_5]
MSDLNAAIARADALAFASSGKHLNDLQRKILTGVWHGERYAIIAERYGYTEGHIKDMGADLWKMLSQVTGERIGKHNFRSAIVRQQPTPPAGTNHLGINFLGRQAAIAKIDTTIEQGHRAIVIQGEGGVGKTTLAQQYLVSKDFDCLLELFVAKEARNIAPAAAIVQEWLGRDFNEEPGQDFATNLARLKRHLCTRRTGILIDNLEPALDKDGCFQANYRDYIELLRVLSDARSQAIVLVTSRDRLCEADLTFTHLRLSGLSVATWSEYFSARGLEIDSEITAALQKTYGGNAKAMGIMAGAIATDFAGDGQAYWQESGNEPLAEISLKNLIAGQFDRLQALDPPTYRLLCRLGCYRYQDIASIPADGLLCLLWEETATLPRRTIASLRNRSLVECARGQYWLHPAVRAEAVARLHNTPDWKKSHQKAAEFWRDRITKIANITDALTAFEAYYHELAIDDFAAAARTILKGRTNQWGQFLSLGSNLYRLGLVQPLLSAILEICDRLSAPELVAELQNILGDLYWICGRLPEAISCQERTIDLARKGLQSLDPAHSEYRDLYFFQM